MTNPGPDAGPLPVPPASRPPISPPPVPALPATVSPEAAAPLRVPLDGPALRARLLAPSGPYARIETVEATGSTNEDLARAAAADPDAWPDLSVLATDFQSAGRGRLDRVWQAPPCSSLAVSVLFRPGAPDGSALPHTAYAWLSLLCAVALADTLREEAGVEAAVKWPNDVLAGGRKISGILARLVPLDPAPAVVVGTGVNISLTADELPAPTATSLLLEGSRHGTTEVLAGFLRRVGRYYTAFVAAGGDPEVPLEGVFQSGMAHGGAPAGLRALVAARMATLGARVRAELPGGRFLEGTATALAPDGALVVRDDAGGLHPVLAGDVVHLRRADGRYA
ncbi:biotin--[acetyl-CoA-carboxylase] ligase [Zafaria cholistanensis]|uniref:biotin--[biotin carboxyl-carrier protein] ligase n=1 Tax=Zafaria cholistanensis TaxID=1682741 RepID=A0A5A7NPD4_9MICC|nr:biotin--[acetyl-CoA-carboxylase] ligase [Zafaria cholistanensis]GER22645.1 biotin--[acetyl-CoA-carboxylase] ligase [Zafaria cholistanensis]